MYFNISTPIYYANLIGRFFEKKSKVVGLSDHSDPEKEKYYSSSRFLKENRLYWKTFFSFDKNLTKDGPVSASPGQLKEISNLSLMKEKDLKLYLKDKGVSIEKIFGSELRELTDTELLNRDYYQGRFAYKDNDNKTWFNWDENYN